MHDKAALQDVIAPVLAQHGLELIRFTMSGSPRQPALMVYVDRVGGVTVAECVGAAKALRHAVAEHFGPGRPFSIGTSSPGTDRPLRTQRDFALIVGRRVMARVQNGDGEADSDIAGVVLRAESEAVVLGGEADNVETMVPYGRIVAAKLKLPYGQ